MAREVLPELIRFWHECCLAAIDEGDPYHPDHRHFDPPVHPIPHTALSDADFHELIQARVSIDGHDPATISLENMPVLVLDSASTHKGQFREGRTIEARGIPHTLNMWPLHSPDLNCLRILRMCGHFMKARINRGRTATDNDELIAQVHVTGAMGCSECRGNRGHHSLVSEAYGAAGGAWWHARRLLSAGWS
jgi:hypothetical protein